jgi:hypothetical protein
MEFAISDLISTKRLGLDTFCPIATLGPVVRIVDAVMVEKEVIVLAVKVSNEMLLVVLWIPFVPIVNTVPKGATVPSVL